MSFLYVYMSNITLRQTKFKDMKLILALDKKVYPTDSSVTQNLLRKWYMRNPEFGMIYENKGKIVGVCIAIPLNTKSWNNFVDGQLSESELAGNCIFDNSKDDKWGLHIYHVERLDASLANLHMRFLKDLSQIIQKLRKTNKHLKVIGFSGLCTTKEGIKLFTDILNCKESRYVSDEHIFEKTGKKYVYHIKSKNELDDKQKKGYKLVNRCKLLVTTPDEKSLVWHYLR